MYVAAALATALSHGQSAGSFTEVGSVFRPNDIEWGLQTTAGSPSVVSFQPWDYAQFLRPDDISLLVYETQTEAPSAGCPAGRWGVGLAFKQGGNNGDLYEDLGAIVTPTAGTYYSCVAAHPTIVELSNVQVQNGQTWLVYFKAEQDCTGQGASCERYTGVGRLVVSYDRYSLFFPSFFAPNFGFSGPDSTPVLTGVAQDMGYPKAAFVAGEYRMAFGQFPDVYLASSPLTNLFSVSPTPVLTAGTPTGWGDDEVLSPSIGCQGNGTLRMYPVGRSWDVSPSVLTDVSVGMFESTTPATDFDTYTEGPGPYVSTSSGNLEPRHVHMASASGYTSYGLYYSTPIGAGNEIRLTATSGFDWRNIDSRRCP
jgi:hypothetical protein